jgi:hypothetical protein
MGEMHFEKLSILDLGFSTHKKRIFLMFTAKIKNATRAFQ